MWRLPKSFHEPTTSKKTHLHTCHVNKHSVFLISKCISSIVYHFSSVTAAQKSQYSLQPWNAYKWRTFDFSFILKSWTDHNNPWLDASYVTHVAKIFLLLRSIHCSYMFIRFVAVRSRWRNAIYLHIDDDAQMTREIKNESAAFSYSLYASQECDDLQ